MMRIFLSSFGTTSRRTAATGRRIFSSASIAMLLTSVLVLATSSCGGAGSSIVGSTLQDVQSFQAAAGDNQVGTAGSDLPTPITVRALTQGGQGVSGVSVHWTFSGGGGSLSPGGTVSQSLTTVTDKQGKSSVYWQLDTIAGDQTATATLSGTSSNSTTSVKFHSQGKAGGPARLVVSPGAATLAVGGSAQFTATVLDRWKNVISGATVNWSSSNDSVLTVSSTGMAKALRSGSATVIATTSASSTSAAGSSSISGGASVSVESSTASTAHAATVTVTPTSLSFTSLNATAQLSAVAKDSTGNNVPNPGFTWKSLATSIATVSTAGLVTAQGVGATVIIVTAACCGSDTAAVTVTQPTSVPDSLLPAPNKFRDDFEDGVLDASKAPLNVDGFKWTGSADIPFSIVNDSGCITYGTSGVINPPECGFTDRQWENAPDGTSGHYAARARYPANSGEFAEQRFNLGKPYADVWFRFWLRVPINFIHQDISGSTTNNKLFAVWMDGYVQAGTGPTVILTYDRSPTNAGGSNWAFAIHQPTALGPDEQTTDGFIVYPSDQGRWMQIVLHLKISSTPTANDGVLETWRRWAGDAHFTKYFEKTDCDFETTSTATGWFNGYILGASNSWWAANTEFLIDDFDVSTTPLVPASDR